MKRAGTRNICFFFYLASHGGFTQKTHHVFCPFCPDRFKNTTITSHFVFVVQDFEENLGREITRVTRFIKYIVFEKLRLTVHPGGGGGTPIKSE